MTELLANASVATPIVPVVAQDPCPRPGETERASCKVVVRPDDTVRDSKILIVDDEPYNIVVVRKYLRDAGYANLITVTDSTQALKTIRTEEPSIVLLDIEMPQVTGIDILRLRRADDHLLRIPTLILTATTDATTKLTALDLGATDFLLKPVDRSDLLPRVRNTLVSKMYQDRLADYAQDLEREVARRTAQLEASRKEIVHCLARAAEYHDDNTGHHVNRVAHYAAIIARALGFAETQVAELHLAVQLHDVGKIAIPDAILNHPGKLDPEMLAVMQKHCIIAKQILTPMPAEEWNALRRHPELGASLLEISSSPLLTMAARIAVTHHERWDGSGYPLGLAGEDIPIEGRITAVADVFDALSSPRAYKSPIPRERCFTIMQEGHGTHFDPAVLDAFFGRSAEIVEVQIQFADGA